MGVLSGVFGVGEVVDECTKNRRGILSVVRCTQDSFVGDVDLVVDAAVSHGLVTSGGILGYTDRSTITRLGGEIRR